MSEAVTSGQIKQALANKHFSDFFLAEVKNGPTMTGMLQVDALAIPKSWAHQQMTGYEIKISRSDFQRDGKMHLYLPYFHEFYIVCPSKMIDKKEVSDEMGLIWYNPETKELTTKKKAAWRKVDIDPAMMWYILMYRLDSDRYPFHDSKTAFIKDYIEDKQTHRRLGDQLRSKMAQKIDHLESEVERLSHNGDYEKTIEDIKAVMNKHGIPTWGWRCKDLATDLDEALSKGYPKELDTLIAQLEIARRTAEKMTGIHAEYEVSS